MCAIWEKLSDMFLKTDIIGTSSSVDDVVCKVVGNSVLLFSVAPWREALLFRSAEGREFLMLTQRSGVVSVVVLLIKGFKQD